VSKAELADQKHEEGFNCAQSVLSVFAEDHGMPLDLALKLASPFGGGMRMAATCGALTGALMALGLACGFDEYNTANKALADQCTLELLNRWRAEIGPTDCKEILGYDVSDPKQKELARAAGAFEAHCSTCIVRAVELVSDLLAELA
jgi:C_GCAxxG_C_C family probable redox protein